MATITITKCDEDEGWLTEAFKEDSDDGSYLRIGGENGFSEKSVVYIDLSDLQDEDDDPNGFRLIIESPSSMLCSRDTKIIWMTKEDARRLGTALLKVARS